MLIGIDIDGVIAKVDTEIHKRLLQWDSEVPDPNTWESYYIEEWARVPHGWFMENCANDETFWMNAIPYKDTWEWVRKAYFAGNEIHVVTARNTEAAYKQTQDWFDVWSIPYTTITMGIPRLEKGAKLAEIGCNFMIEDDPHGAAAVSEYMPCYLVNRPYNIRYKDVGGAERITSVKDIKID